MGMQKFIWVAEYDDGTFLREFNDDGSENSFYDIKRDRLKKFSLVGCGKSYGFDCRTGVFSINGEELRVRFIADNGDCFEFMGQSGPYNDIIQYKEASTAFNLLQNRVVDKIDSHNIGWKAKFIFEQVTFHVKFILSVSPDGDCEYIYVWLVADKYLRGVIEFQLGDRRQQFPASLGNGMGGEIRWTLK